MAKGNRLAVCAQCGTRLHVSRVTRPDPDRVVRTKVCPNPKCGARLSTIEQPIPTAPPAIAASGRSAIES